MADSYLAKNHKRQYFVFDPQDRRYGQHVLTSDTMGDLSVVYGLVLQADERQDDDPKQIFLVFPQNKDSEDTFHIFNKATGKAWNKNVTPGIGNLPSTILVGEKEFDPNDTGAQVFKIVESSTDGVIEIQFLDESGNVFAFDPGLQGMLVSQDPKDLKKNAYRFVPGSGGEITVPKTVPKTVNRGNPLMLAPLMTKRELPKPCPYFATRVGRIPFFMVRDDAKDLAWKAQNSPWYYLRRRLRYVTDALWFSDNGTSKKQVVKWDVKKSWTKTESTSFSATLGVSIKALDLGLGYTRESTISATYEESFGKEFTVPPKKAATMWQPESKFDLLRGDGSIVRTWTKMEPETAYREFPDDMAGETGDFAPAAKTSQTK